uniref:G_PROTEIN_RECEP_F1_2 domain-containing protein n=1 Tax=Parastrongyloides trichosuri TaxID=131310 RepID=A0A0N4ZAN2_PARTI
MDNFNTVYKNDGTIYIELNGYYNLLLIISGILSFPLNILYLYVIYKEKLWKLSVHYILTIIIVLGGIALGLRHLIIGIINFVLLDPSIISYDNVYCKVKTIIDIFLLYSFEFAYSLRTGVLTFLIAFPIFYRNYIEKEENNKYIIFSNLVIAVLSTIIFGIDNGDNLRIKNCNIYSFTGKIYEIIFLTIIGIFTVTSVLMFFFGLYKVLHVKLNQNAKESLIKLYNVNNSIYLFFWVLPNLSLFLTDVLNIHYQYISLSYDISIFAVSVIGIAEFPLALWQNKTVRESTINVFGIQSKVSTISNIIS